MKPRLTTLIPYLIILLLGLILHFGLTQMYFHQDDLTYLINSNINLLDLLTQPVNEHLHYTFTLLFKLEWQFFRLHFAPYLITSLLLHLLNLPPYSLPLTTTGMRQFFGSPVKPSP